MEKGVIQKTVRPIKAGVMIEKAGHKISGANCASFMGDLLVDT